MKAQGSVKGKGKESTVMEKSTCEAIEGVVSYYSPTESARFRRTVRRYVLQGTESAPLLAGIETENPDLAIVRIPTSRVEVLFQLNELCREVILGDCLVVYERPNEKVGVPGPSLNRNFDVRQAGISQLDLLDSMTESIFAGYKNHYHANPELKSFDLVDGYKEWVRSYVDAPERGCFIGFLNDEPCCYATLCLKPQEGTVILNGVLPEYRRRGVYRDLLRRAVQIIMEANSPVTTISTQVDNIYSQRVWVKEGFLLAGSFYTVHLNLKTPQRSRVGKSHNEAECGVGCE